MCPILLCGYRSSRVGKPHPSVVCPPCCRCLLYVVSVSRTRRRQLPGYCLRVDLGELAFSGLLRSMPCLTQVPMGGAVRFLQPGRVMLSTSGIVTGFASVCSAGHSMFLFLYLYFLHQLALARVSAIGVMAREPRTEETHSDGAGTVDHPARRLAEPTDADFCEWFVAWFQRVVCREPTNDHWPSGLHFAAIVTQPYGTMPTAMFLTQRRRSTAHFEARFCTPAVCQTQHLSGTAEEASSSCEALADEDCGARADS